jgi:hypothetical protein
VSQPDVLYHGSPVLVPVLEPLEGFVCAADDRQVAIPFALAFRPDQRGRSKWTLHMHATEPRISIEHGWLDTTGVGYLYRLPADRFEYARYQWLSREPVTPLGHEIIRSADYAGWIASGEIR